MLLLILLSTFAASSLASPLHWQIAAKLVASDIPQCWELGLNGIENPSKCGGCNANSICVTSYQGPQISGNTVGAHRPNSNRCTPVPSRCSFALVDDGPPVTSPPFVPDTWTPESKTTTTTTTTTTTPRPTTPVVCDVPRANLRRSRSCRRPTPAFVRYRGTCRRLNVYTCGLDAPTFIFKTKNDCDACGKDDTATAPVATEPRCLERAKDRAWVKGCPTRNRKTAYSWDSTRCVVFTNYNCPADKLGRTPSTNSFSSLAECRRLCDTKKKN